MKKEHPIRTLLGISQEETAQLLGIGRTQWSMFELGKRDLPLAAKQLLAELLTHVQTPEPIVKTPPGTPQHIRHVEKLLLENRYQLEKLSRIVDKMTKAHEAQTRLLRLASFLEDRTNGKLDHFYLSREVSAKVIEAQERPVAAALSEYLHEHEMLVLENILLQARLRNLEKNSPGGTAEI